MKITPHIKQEYYDMIPRPSDESRLALRISIENDGQQEPIIVNEKGVILDGHTRFEICKELGIPCKFTVKKTKSDKEEINHSIIINSKRRNLNDFQLYELFEEQIDNLQKENRINNTKKRVDTMGGKTEGILEQEDKNRSRTVLRRQASELTGIKEGNIMMVRYLKKHADSVLLDYVRSGGNTISNAYQSIYREKEPRFPKTIKSKKDRMKEDETIVSHPEKIKPKQIFHDVPCPTCKGTGIIEEEIQ